MKTLKKSFGLLLILSLSLATVSLQSCGNKKADTNASDSASGTKTESTNSTSETKTSGGSSNCAKIAEDYGKFVDEYIDIIQKYKKDPTNTAYLKDYTDYIQKAQTLSSDMQANKDCSTDMTYIGEISKHIKRMADAATQK